ncbi:MAG: CIA30 family protein [Phycisphaerae bacterium]|nr:CIA30 family protein [Phycisphaerae bacterium]
MKNEIFQSIKMFLCLLLVAGLAVFAPAKEKSQNTEKQGADLLLDDFGDSSPDGSPMRQWQFVADTVMGGKSTGSMEMVSYDEKKCLRMTGDVSLENNGGFIQCRSFLKDGRKMFDASDFDGIKLMVKGNGHKYAVHLRTSRTWLPWQYYEVKFDTSGDWQEILVPFDKFKPYSLKKALNKGKIKSIAIVAIGEKIKADIYVDQVSLY